METMRLPSKSRAWTCCAAQNPGVHRTKRQAAVPLRSTLITSVVCRRWRAGRGVQAGAPASEELKSDAAQPGLWRMPD